MISAILLAIKQSFVIEVNGDLDDLMAVDFFWLLSSRMYIPLYVEERKLDRNSGDGNLLNSNLSASDWKFLMLM